MNNNSLSNFGRFGDNEMAHVQSGEVVVPSSVLNQNPSLSQSLSKAFINQGVNPSRQVVGSPMGSFNPMTGQQEFFNLGSFAKQAAPIALSAFLGPAAGTAIGGMTGTAISPLVSRALTGALASKLTGGSTKDALKTALLSGITGAGIDYMSGGADAAQQGGQTIVRKGAEQTSTVPASNPDVAKKMGAEIPAEKAAKGIAETFKPKTFSAELLKSAGVGGDNLFSRLLNTQMGEGLTAGLLMQLLSGSDDDEDTRTGYEKRPFGAGGPGGRLGGITYANYGGQMGFPRRDGGIDPSEGSGRKDDVPAMLTAGEFVLTKDAVKGLGGGNQRRGIERAYNMMDNLEARA